MLRCTLRRLASSGSGGFRSVALGGGRGRGGPGGRGPATNAAKATIEKSGATIAAAARKQEAVGERPPVRRQESPLSEMPLEEVLSKVTKYGKHRPPKSSAAHKELVALLADIADHRAGHLPPKVFREILTVAQAADEHNLAIRIFFQRAKASRTNNLHFSLLPSVVDSGYYLGDADSLIRLAEVGAEKIETVSNEILSDLAFARLLWRCACLDVRAARRRGAQSKNKKQSSGSARQQQLPQHEEGEGAERRRGNSQAPIAPGVGKTVFDTAWRLLRNVNERLVQQEPEAVWEKLVQAVLYSYYVDLGEMQAMKECLQCDLVKPVWLEQELDGERRLLLYVTLLRTCQKGSWVDQAEQYYLEFTQGQTNVPEQLLYTYYTILVNGKEQKRLLSSAIPVLQDNGQALSPGLVAVIAGAACDVNDTATVELCFNCVVLDRGDKVGVTPFVVHQLVNALAKVSSPRFHDYLQHCVEGKLLDTSAEAIANLSLQYALTSSDPLSAVESCVQSMEENNVQLTERLVDKILLTYQRVETPLFLPFFQHVVDELRMPCKAQWLEQLLMWSDRRQYFLSREEKHYILGTVKKETERATSTAVAMHAVVEDYRSIIAQLQRSLEEEEDENEKGSSSTYFPQLKSQSDSKLLFLRRTMVDLYAKPTVPHRGATARIGSQGRTDTDTSSSSSALSVLGIPKEELYDEERHTDPASRFFECYVLDVLRDTQMAEHPRNIL